MRKYEVKLCFSGWVEIGLKQIQLYLFCSILALFSFLLIAKSLVFFCFYFMCMLVYGCKLREIPFFLEFRVQSEAVTDPVGIESTVCDQIDDYRNQLLEIDLPIQFTI